MKKIAVGVILTISVLCHGLGKENAAPAFTLFLQMDHMFPADGSYRELYGFSSFLPTARAEVKVNNKNYIWVSVSFLKEPGTSAGELNESIEASQYFAGFGGGYRFKLSRSAFLDFRYGAFWCSYKETAFGEEFSGDTFGAELGIDYKMRIFSKVFVGLSAGYMIGKAEVTETKTGINPGGFKTGLGLGIGF